MSESLPGVFVCKALCSFDMFTDVSDTEQGEQEGKEGRGKCEELPVSLEDLEFVCQACDHGLHATHLVERKTLDQRQVIPMGLDDMKTKGPLP